MSYIISAAVRSAARFSAFVILFLAFAALTRAQVTITSGTVVTTYDFCHGCEGGTYSTVEIQGANLSVGGGSGQSGLSGGCIGGSPSGGLAGVTFNPTCAESLTPSPYGAGSSLQLVYDGATYTAGTLEPTAIVLTMNFSGLSVIVPNTYPNMPYEPPGYQGSVANVPFTMTGTVTVYSGSTSGPVILSVPISGTGLYSAGTIGSIQGGPGEGYATYQFRPPSPTVFGLDGTTDGSWVGKYGSDGYLIANGPASLPAYASVSVSGSTPYTWASQTSDPRALNLPGSSNGIASAYTTPYPNNSFNINIDFTDGKTHQVGLYALDFDNVGRTETVTITDANTNAVLDSEVLAQFAYYGQYASWDLSGNVVITVTPNSGETPVISGIFFDAASKSTVPTPNFTLSATAASIASGSSGLSTVTVNPLNAFTSTVGLVASGWPAGITGTFTPSSTATTSSVAISVASSVASGMYSLTVVGTSGSLSATATITLTVTAATAPNFTISATPLALPAGVNGASMVTASWTGSALPIVLASSGWPTGITTSASTITPPATTAGVNIYVAAGVAPGSYSLTLIGTSSGVSSVTTIALTVLGGSTSGSSAAYKGLDTSTLGYWNGKYGGDGFLIANDAASSLPSYATVSVTGASTYTWTPMTTDGRALQSGKGYSSGIASTYYGNTFDININLTDGNTHQVAVYLLDWDTTTRTESIVITDAASGVVLDQESFSGFNLGEWAVWNIKGNVTLKVTTTNSGNNAVVSGIFFGPPSGTSTPSPSFTLSASAASIAAGSSGKSTVTVNPLNGFSAAVGLATSAWPSGITGSFTPTSTATSSTVAISVGAGVMPGVYSLTVSGTSGSESVLTTIALTVTGGSNQGSSPIYAGLDATTQGAWTGKYGSTGYLIANVATSSAYASVTGASTFTWAGQTSDPRALQSSPGASTRIASAYTQYPNTGFSFDVGIQDSKTHKVSLYLLDWDSTSRTETVTILDAATNTVLDTETFSGFHNGQYASWNVTGNVIIKVTPASGVSPVVSGVFID